jgi:hypothetical protein
MVVGAKPLLRPKHVWSIRTKLEFEGRVRDLALLNLAVAVSSVVAKSCHSKTSRAPRFARCSHFIWVVIVPVRGHLRSSLRFPRAKLI